MRRSLMLLVAVLVTLLTGACSSRQVIASAQAAGRCTESRPAESQLRRADNSDFSPSLTVTVDQQGSSGTWYLTAALSNAVDGERLWVNSRFEVVSTGAGADTITVEDLGSNGAIVTQPCKVRASERRYRLLSPGETIIGQVSLRCVDFEGAGPWKMRLRYRDRGNWPIPLPPEDVPWFSGEIVSNEIEVPAPR